MTNITLFCLIQEDNPNNIFEVEIESNKYIKDLREEIKKKKPDLFGILDIDKLRKVNITNDDNDRVFKAQPCVSIEDEGEELEETKKVIDYFSKELTEKDMIILHIIIQRKPLSVVLFGITGHGKSTLANMLIQGDIKPKDNTFKVNDAAKGETDNIQASVNEVFEVFDTVGLNEPKSGSVAHEAAVKKIRDYFSKCDVHLNYIFYVKMKGRFTNDDVKMFKIFKKIFEGGEQNFVIIITRSKQGWVDDNSEIIKENFGDYPIIPVDFHYDKDDDEEDEERYKKSRRQCLQHLIERLFKLNNKGIKLEILDSSQKTEDNIAKVVDLLPVVGSMYQLISAGVYHKLGKPKASKDRLISGVAGLAFDIMSLGTVGVGRSAGKAVASSVSKALAGNVAQRISMKVVEKSSEIKAEEEKKNLDKKNLDTKNLDTKNLDTKNFDKQ